MLATFRLALSRNLPPRRTYFAVVNHAIAYQRQAIQGRHGQQLSLAEREGVVLPVYDPFSDAEDNDEHMTKFEDEDSDEEESLEDNEEEESLDNQDGNDTTTWIDPQADAWKHYQQTYHNDGSLRRDPSQLATWRAGAPAGGLFAIVELAGSQHKVTTDDVWIVNRLKPLDRFAIGTTHVLDNVLLVGSTHATLVGLPYVTGATVTVLVEEITQDEKVVVFHKRRRKHSQRKNGMRRDVTMLRVLEIGWPNEVVEEPSYLERSSSEGGVVEDEHVA